MNDWSSLVKEGKEAVNALGESKWQLGDLARKVETKHGEQSLQTFADEVGVSYDSLRRYRDVAKAYPDPATRVAIWSVHRILSPKPVRHLLKEGMTAAEAQRAVDEWAVATGTKQAEKSQQSKTDGLLALTMKTIPVADKSESTSPAADAARQTRTAKGEALAWEDDDPVIIDGGVIAEEWGDGEGKFSHESSDDGTMILEAAQELDGAVRYAAELRRQWDTAFVTVVEDSWGEQPMSELYLAVGNLAVNLKKTMDRAHNKPMEVAA